MGDTEADWDRLRDELEQAASSLIVGATLTLKVKGSEDLGILFERFPKAGVRLSAPSDRFLRGDEVLGARSDKTMLELGWLPPVDNVSQGHRSPSSYYREWPYPVDYDETARLALGTVRSVYSVKRTEELGYEAYFSGGRFVIEELHLEALEDAMLGPTIGSSADDLRIYLDAYLGELTHQDSLAVDEQGTFLVQSQGVHMFAGVVEGNPPTAWIAAPLLWDVEESLELLQAINQMNVAAEAGRVIWNGSQVVIEDRFPSYVLNIQDLSNALERIVALAGKYGPELFERFSGTTSSSGSAPNSPDGIGYL